MSEIKEILYNLFWQNKACQNLFLLSKEELLDTKKIELDGVAASSVSFPRIIISNVESKADDTHETIKIRNENNSIKTENLISSKIQLYEPILNNFLESKFGKSLEKLVNDFNEDPLKIAGKAITLFAENDGDFELVILRLLQEYGFVGKHLNSFSELEQYFQKEAIVKNSKTILSENNIWNLLEFFKSIKDIYVAESYKSLYNTNQILVNALHSNDDFNSRIQLFNLLFESNIISSSKEDAFIECSHCITGTYRGVFQLKLNPKKLNELKCPVCFRNLTYYVPYELHKDIYQVVKQKDGIIFDALSHLLTKKKIAFKTNQVFLNDIEIDCLFHGNEIDFVVECKMYKINTSAEKLRTKLKEHFGKLAADVVRLKESNLLNQNIQPFLVVNIIDEDLLKQVEAELFEVNQNEIAKTVKIFNISQFKKWLGKAQTQ